jgi:predicted nucleic acid-binding protein
VSYLLDTNVVSELRKPVQRGHPGVRRWAASQPAETLYLSVITVLEVEIGVALAERRDVDQGRRLRDWLHARLLSTFDHRILPVDLAVARRAAGLHVPDPRPERDALIGATALTHDLVVATRNESDFEPLGVDVLNPWNVD